MLVQPNSSPPPLLPHSLAFKVVVYNTGTNPAAGLYLVDEIPPQITNVAFTSTYSTNAIGPLSGTAADLALLQIAIGAGGSAEFVVTGTVDPATTSAVNRVSLQPPSGQTLSPASTVIASASWPLSADPVFATGAKKESWEPVKEVSKGARGWGEGVMGGRRQVRQASQPVPPPPPSGLLERHRRQSVCQNQRDHDEAVGG